MEAFEKQGYSSQKLQMLNRCRIYLQAFTLSDLMTGKGNSFTETYRCQRDHQKWNRYKWPFQPTPSQKMIKLWRSTLRKTFQLKAGVTGHKVGRWLHLDFKEWRWFFHPHSKSIYQRFGHVWKVWKRETQRSNGPQLTVQILHSKYQTATIR